MNAHHSNDTRVLRETITKLEAERDALRAALVRCKTILEAAFNPGGDERILSVCRSESQLAVNQARAALAQGGAK